MSNQLEKIKEENDQCIKVLLPIIIRMKNHKWKKLTDLKKN